MACKETNKFKLSLVSNNYFYLEIKGDIEFEMEDLDLLIECQKELGEGKSFPVLINPAVTATTNSDVIKRLARKSSLPYTKADAFILKSVPQKILGKLYIALRAERPTKYFSTKDDALKWLEQYF